MMKIRILYIGMLLFLACSCMKEQGTYDYLEINEMRVDTLNTRISQIYDTLKISPVLIQSLPVAEEELEYVWYYYPLDKKSDTDTIGREKKLNYKVNLGVGKYTIYLKVTDKRTGLSANQHFQLEVVGQFTAGLMVLGVVDGKSSFVFVNNAGTVTTVYEGTTGDVLGQNPVLIADARTLGVSQRMMVFSDDTRGGVSLNSTDFKKEADYTDLFYFKPETVRPQMYKKIAANGYNLGDMIINDGKLYPRYTGPMVSAADNIKYSPAIPGDYTLSPYMVCVQDIAVFYDTKKGRFHSLTFDMFEVAAVFKPLQTKSTTIFDPEQIGLKLVYWNQGYKKRSYAIFQDEKNGELYRLTFNLQYSGSWGSNYIAIDPLDKKQITNAPDIESALGYAMATTRPTMYYTKDNVLYMYDLDNLVNTPVYNLDSVVADSRIDRIYMKTGMTWDGTLISKDVLYLASSQKDKTGKNGSIHILQLNTSGTVKERTALYQNICGRTVSLDYKP